jgi:hypothetical protein
VTDLGAWAKRWNVTLRQPAASRRRPVLGFFAAGLIVGAIGSYAISQRSLIKRLLERAVTARRELLSEFGGVDLAPSVSVKSDISNHRRKAVAEVK